MRDSVLFSEVSLRRNYQDLTFCPQDDAEDLSQSYHRSIAALTRIHPDYRVFDGQALGEEGLPFGHTIFLPPKGDQLTKAALFTDNTSSFSAAINLDEHLVLRRTGKPDEHRYDFLRGSDGACQSQPSFAHDAQYGYLSYRPALAGGGACPLVMHLPTLHCGTSPAAKAKSAIMPAAAKAAGQRGCTRSPTSAALT